MSRATSSVRGRLLLLLAVVLAPLLAAQAVVYRSYLQASREQAVTANLEMARALARSFHSFLDDILRTEFAIGSALTSPAWRSPEDASRLLQANRDVQPVVRDFHWLDSQGRALASSNPQAVGLVALDRPYFQSILQGATWSVSDLLQSRLTAEPVFAISRGIQRPDGSLAGVVMAAIQADRLSDILFFARGPGVVITVLDRSGRAVYRLPAAPWSWEERLVGQTDPHLSAALAGQEASGVAPGWTDGVQRVYGMVPIPLFGWVIRVSEPLDQVMAGRLQDLLEQGLLFLAALVSGVVAAFFISRTISEPLLRLRAYALAADSERSSTFRSSGPAEVRDLAAALSRSFGELKETHRQLEGSKRELERRVEERTAQLARANRELRAEVEQRRRAEAALEAQQGELLVYQERLRALAAELVATADRERRQLAAALHDRIGQALAASKIKLQLLRGSLREEGPVEQVAEVIGFLDETIQDTRTLVFEIHPPVLHHAGLEAALQWLAEKLQREHGLRVEILREGPETAAGDGSKVLLFRTVRELLMNVSKHARVNSARVRLCFHPQELTVTVEDGGQGFDAARVGQSPTFGLFSVREQVERAGGALSIHSQPGRGTTVTVTLPAGTAAVETGNG